MVQEYPVIGAGGETQVRREIRDISTDQYQWTLFIKALTNIMDPNKDQKNDPALWQQMGTGDPNGAPGPVNPSGDHQWEGYCHHAFWCNVISAAIFPTWHQVSVPLVEQSIVCQASTIAQELASQCSQQSEKENWINAANALRLPYWDWTLPETGQNGVPAILMSTTTQILDPTQPNPVTVTNPLYSYRLNGINDNFDDDEEYPMYFKEWPQTYRWPDNKKPISEDNPTSLQKYFHALNVMVKLVLTAKCSAFQNGVKMFEKFYPGYTGTLQEVQNLFKIPMGIICPQKYRGNMWDIFSSDHTPRAGRKAKQRGYGSIVHVLGTCLLKRARRWVDVGASFGQKGGVRMGPLGDVGTLILADEVDARDKDILRRFGHVQDADD
ncbi:hypothetical protein CPB86DRAFT_801605 [Serendipita vermifera]|nr:hypothetical protein CPB86DRAFT_801605 [Serendipita vermifera]